MEFLQLGMVVLIIFAISINYTLRTKNSEDSKMREMIKAYIEYRMNNK